MRSKLDPDPHGEKQLGPYPQKMNADPQPCGVPVFCRASSVQREEEEKKGRKEARVQDIESLAVVEPVSPGIQNLIYIYIKN